MEEEKSLKTALLKYSKSLSSRLHNDKKFCFKENTKGIFVNRFVLFKVIESKILHSMDDFEDSFVLFMVIGFSIFGAFAICSFLCICCFVIYRKNAAKATYSSKYIIFEMYGNICRFFYIFKRDFEKNLLIFKCRHWLFEFDGF